jgi:hypothetical protein
MAPNRSNTNARRPAPGSRVAGNQRKLSKNWRDESLIRAAMADARCITHFKRWPPSALAGWRKRHGKPE